MLLITARPERLSPSVMEALDLILAVGSGPERTLRLFGAAAPVALEEGEVLAWSNGQAEPLRLSGKAPQGRSRAPQAPEKRRTLPD